MPKSPLGTRVSSVSCWEQIIHEHKRFKQVWELSIALRQEGKASHLPTKTSMEQALPPAPG